MTAPPRVLVLIPHPDDEAYALAGTLALCREQGAAVHVLCLTRGERGGRRRGSNVSGSVSDLRPLELEQSCRVLDLAPPKILDLPDGGLADLPGVELTGLLVREIVSNRPDLVLGPGDDGAYGNRDHMAVARALREAFRSGEFGSPPRLLLSAFPSGLFQPIFASLKKKKGQPVVGDPTGGMLGMEREQADLIVDIRPYRDQKIASVWAHRSQLLEDDPFTFLMPGFLWKLLDEEWFIHAAGPPLPVDARSPLDGLLKTKAISRKDAKGAK